MKWRTSKSTTKRWLVVVMVGVLVFAVGVGVGSHLQPTQFAAEKLGLANTSVEQSELEVQDYDLVYEGQNITNVTVEINNTDAQTDITANVTATLLHNGTVESDGTTEEITIPADSTETVAVNVTDTSATNVDTIDIRVKETNRE